jgi:hypothetical protein
VRPAFLSLDDGEAFQKVAYTVPVDTIFEWPSPWNPRNSLHYNGSQGSRVRISQLSIVNSWCGWALSWMFLA